MAKDPTLHSLQTMVTLPSLALTIILTGIASLAITTTTGTTVAQPLRVAALVHQITTLIGTTVAQPPRVVALAPQMVQ